MPVKPELSRREENARATRQALLDAARDVFAEKGYADASTEEIVSRARVTRGALYHHFDNKEHLFRAVVDQLVNNVVQSLVAQGMAGQLVDDDDIWSGFRAGMRAYLDACLDTAFQRIVVTEVPVVFGTELTRAEQGALILERGWLERAMAEGHVVPLPVDALTALLAGLVQAAGRYLANARDKPRARAEIGDALDAVLQGLAAPARPTPRQKAARGR